MSGCGVGSGTASCVKASSQKHFFSCMTHGAYKPDTAAPGWSTGSAPRHVSTPHPPVRRHHSRYRTSSSASRRPRIENTKNHCTTPTRRRAGPPSGDPPSAACVPQRQKRPNHERPPEASRWPHGTESSLSGPAMGSSKRMPSALGGLAKVRAHAARTDRPFEEGPARREKRSAGASERVRCGERGRAHHHRTEHRRIELGRPLLLASCARR